MSNSKTSQFAALYARDMEKVYKETLGLAGAAVILILLGLTPWTKNVVLLPLIIVSTVATFLPLLTAVLWLGREWREHTIYQLMALPVGGAQVLGAKLLASISQMVINQIINAAMIFICLYQRAPMKAIDWTQAWQQIQTALNQSNVEQVLPFVIVMIILFFIYVTAGLQLGMLIGKLFRKFTGPAIVAADVGVFWISSYLFGALVSLLPEQHYNIVLAGPPVNVPAQDLSLITLFGVLVIVLVFMGSVFVYNRYLEV